MLTLLEGRLIEYSTQIAEVYNACRQPDVPSAEAAVDEWLVRRAWFGPGFRPRDFCAATYSGRVAGLAWAWVRGGIGWVYTCVDPRNPSWLVHATFEALLSWVRHRLEEERMTVVKFRAGFEEGVNHRAIRYLIGECRTRRTGLLMEAPHYLSGSEPTEYVIRSATDEDIPDIVRILNEAFAEYEWFVPTTSEAYRRRIRDLRSAVLVAEAGGKIVGFAEGRVRRMLDGSLTGYVDTVAVDPAHRGRGLGKALLARLINELRASGVTRVVLVAAPAAIGFYARLGFRPVRWFAIVECPINALPSNPLPNYRRVESIH